jgi:hypothetical protein
MPAQETTRSSANGLAIGQRPSHGVTFSKIIDARKQAVRAVGRAHWSLLPQLKVKAR